MSRFVSYTTHRLELGTGNHGPEWLDIRDKLSYYERQKLNSAMFNLEISEGTSRSMSADLGKYRPAILEAWVAGWQMWDDEGKAVPFSQVALSRMDDDTCEAAIQHIDSWDAVSNSGKGGMATAMEGKVIEMPRATEPVST